VTAAPPEAYQPPLGREAEARRGPVAGVAPAERLALVALTLVDGLGPKRVRALLRALGSASAATDAAVRGQSWPPLPRLGRSAVDALARRVDLRAAELEVARAARVGATLLCQGDPDYPHAWSAFDDLPLLLYWRGRRADSIGGWPPRSVAVVGSRRASAAGCAFAFDVSRLLAEGGETVVSGLALGVDAAAHRGAVASGRASATIAVLAGGVDRPSPAANAPLARSILDVGGALVSETPIGGRVETHAFPRRNRLIAALARAVLVVEAGPASGANLTAGHAAGYGRDVLVCPARPWDAAMAGNLSLLRDGATPVCSVHDALGLLGVEGEARSGSPAGDQRLPEFAAPAAWAWEVLGETPQTADDLVAASGRPVAAVLAALERLVAAGAVAVDGARRYRRVPVRRAGPAAER
jgi:DNA processing protein